MCFLMCEIVSIEAAGTRARLNWIPNVPFCPNKARIAAPLVPQCNKTFPPPNGVDLNTLRKLKEMRARGKNLVVGFAHLDG